WWFCNRLSYTQLPTGVTIPAGGIIVIHVGSSGTNTSTDIFLSSMVSLNTSASDISFYFNSTFTSSSSIRDFVQWGSGGNGRESVAASAGIWTAGDFIPNVAEGHSIEYDGDGNSSSDWSDQPEPTIGQENGVLTPAPSISIQPDSLDYGDLILGSSSDLNITVSNIGDSTLTVSDINSSSAAFTLSDTSFSLQPDSSMQVKATFTPDSVGQFTGTLTIFSNDPVDSTVSVSLTGTASVPQPSIIVTSKGDGGDSSPGDGVCEDGTGDCTLRAAIEEANAFAGKDTISFAIPGAGVHTIQPSFALPTITDSVVIDGYTQLGASPNTYPIASGSNAVLKIEIDGTNAGDTDGFTIGAGNSTIKGLVINRFSGNGIVMITNGGNRIEGNFLGTDVSGTAALGNGNGVGLLSSNNIIGGTTPETRNVISGNFGEGVSIAGDDTLGGNLVQGNYIGTDLTGTGRLNNTTGVLVLTSNNTIGGMTEAARNVISTNLTGISIGSPDLPIVWGNLVEGNFIGTNAAGTAELGNDIGIIIANARDNILGGTTEGARNIISGNFDIGILIDGAEATGNLLQGNYIGTDVTGTVALGNGISGVIFQSASGNTVGGSTEAANLIAFNGDDGVEVIGVSAGNAILSNSIFSNNQGFPGQTGLGIDLHPDGIRQANDPGDADTGPNNLQNYPDDLVYEIDGNGDLMIDYRVDSDPSNSAYPLTVQFFESFPVDIPSGIGDQGEGKFFLGEDVYALTDFNTGIKTVNFGNAVGLGITLGDFIVATATDSNGNTSEFSFPDTVDTTVVIGITSESVIIPENYSLLQNFPNPFNPVTTIRFGLPKESKVNLSIYNILGEKLESIILGQKPAGYHKVIWNASNVSSGIYFYRLEAGDFVQTRKMVLLK
ncbi:choice-of-anchor D domain-containing protein, partial [Candidatus Marinimicrobia bacterium MT.SAG.2]